MLVLTRKIGEQVLIGDDIVVTVLDVRGDGIKVGIDAPRGLRIQRREVVLSVADANVEAARTSDDAEQSLKALFSAAGSLDGAQDSDFEPPASPPEA